MPSGKKYVGTENLLKKDKKTWLSIETVLIKSKKTRDFNFLYFFPSFPQFQDSKEQMEVE